jgi:cbb3-type cytochrome oxidase maturation protein
MSVILILILASLAVAGGFLAAFIWAVRSGQYEDTQTPPMRILPDEESRVSPSTRSVTNPGKLST